MTGLETGESRVLGTFFLLFLLLLNVFYYIATTTTTKTMATTVTRRRDSDLRETPGRVETGRLEPLEVSFYCFSTFTFLLTNV